MNCNPEAGSDFGITNYCGGYLTDCVPSGVKMVRECLFHGPDQDCFILWGDPENDRLAGGKSAEATSHFCNGFGTVQQCYMDGKATDCVFGQLTLGDLHLAGRADVTGRAARRCKRDLCRRVGS